MIFRLVPAKEKKCKICGISSPSISETLGVCRSCILNHWDKAEDLAKKAHHLSREEFSLPLEPPKEGKGCGQCVNVCKILEGGRGFCGVRGNVGGKIESLVDGAVVEWYHDPLPTNCVADFVCPGGTGVGYPQYSHSKGPEFGYKNLAVFYGACTYDCLFCQNWHYRSMSRLLQPLMTAEELASHADEGTSCICYFGGDPTPQIQHAIETSKLALQGRKIMRICFETNGSMNLLYLKQIAELSYESGGCIKFDLKSWNENLNLAMCAASNKQTLKNFEWLAQYGRERGGRGVPFLVASTLLVPGYVNEEEVQSIASFIASLDENIPYSLLAFHPHFYMSDMPLTDKRTAEKCLRIAKEAGLRKVRIGNVHLLI